MAAFVVARADPLRWWSPSELEGIGRALGRRLGGWFADWSPDAAQPEARFSCMAARSSHASSEAQWVPAGTGTGAAWIEGGMAGARAMSAWLFRSPAEAAEREGPIAAAVAARGLGSLASALGRSLALDPGADSPPRAAVFLPWSGAVVASPVGGGPALRLLIDGDCAAALVARDPREPGASVGLVPVAAALASRRLRAAVRLSACEVDLGTLASLRVGDVLSLPHPLDAPAAVLGEGAMLCGAYLGSHAGAKAIELTREAPAAGAGVQP